MKGIHLLSFDDAARNGWSAWPRRAARTLLSTMPVRRAVEARYDHHFETASRAHLFRGVYASFEDAQRHAPPTKPMGYDNPGPAAMYRSRPAMLPLSEYPVLFWLACLLPGAARLFDFGGHVGVRYYDFRSRLMFPAGFMWQVMDVPAVVEAGRRLAVENAAAELMFTERRDDLAGADVLYASGSLQYLERPLPEILAPIIARPRHVIINHMPMRDGPARYTLQSIGTAFCPYRLEDRASFLAGMAALGYELVEQWTCPEKYCPIPFHADYSVRGYTGMYLRGPGA